MPDGPWLAGEVERLGREEDRKCWFQLGTVAVGGVNLMPQNHWVLLMFLLQ